MTSGFIKREIQKQSEASEEEERLRGGRQSSGPSLPAPRSQLSGLQNRDPKLLLSKRPHLRCFVTAVLRKESKPFWGLWSPPLLLRPPELWAPPAGELGQPRARRVGEQSPRASQPRLL